MEPPPAPTASAAGTAAGTEAAAVLQRHTTAWAGRLVAAVRHHHVLVVAPPGSGGSHILTAAAAAAGARVHRVTAEALQWPADRRAWLHITQMLGRFLGGRGGRRPAWLLLDDADAWDEEPPSGSRGASAAAIAKALLQAPVPASGHRIVALVHSPRAWLSTVLADSLEATCRATPRRPYGSPTTAVSDGTTDCGEAWTRLRIPQAEDRLVVAAAVQALAPAAAPAAAVLWQARAAHAARAATFRYVAAHLQHSMAAAAVWGGWLGAGGGAARAASKAVAQLLAHRPPPASLAAAASDYARTLRVLHCVSDGDGGVVVTAGTAGTAGTCRHCGLNWDEAAAGVVTGGVPRHWLVGCSMQGLGAARLGAVGALAGLASDLDVLAAERWRRGGRHSVAGAAAVEEDAAVAVLGVHVLRAAAAGRPAGAATPLRYQRDPAAAVRRQRGFLELETNSVLRSAAAAGASTERRRRLQAAAALQVVLEGAPPEVAAAALPAPRLPATGAPDLLLDAPAGCLHAVEVALVEAAGAGTPPEPPAPWLPGRPLTTATTTSRLTERALRRTFMQPALRAWLARPTLEATARAARHAAAQLGWSAGAINV